MKAFFRKKLLMVFIMAAGLTERREAELIDWENIPEGCTSVLVGKKASVDGSTMTTHTCDCGVCDWTWRHVPAAEHKEGAKRKIYHINQYVTWPPDEGLKWERIKDNDNLHYEVSTNEIINEAAFKELWHNLKTKTCDEVDGFLSRLGAKIDTLGVNYTSILKEQMGRLVEA